MKGFVQGADRQQTTLLPECVDDWVDESNPVRAVDVFVDALELRDLGFGAGAERGLPACVAAELARPLRPIPVGYKPDGALDGLAALLTSRRLHRCLGGVTFGLAARVGPAVVLAARPCRRRTSDASAGFGASASAFRIPCSRRSPRAFRARGGWTNHCPVQRGRTPLYQRSITRGLGCRKGGSLRRMATKALTLFSCAFSTPANATYRSLRRQRRFYGVLNRLRL
jgi:hypothetical protein